jgi:hypothetical protein
MGHVKAIALLLALLSASAVAEQISDAQMACAAAATKLYSTANTALVSRSLATGMPVDDMIAQRRLVETFASNGPDASLAGFG